MTSASRQPPIRPPEPLATWSRRRFLVTSAGAAGALAAQVSLAARATASAGGGAPWLADGYVRLDTEGTVTIRLNRPEMGQGTFTALPMLIAEELDADWSSVRAEWAPVGPPFDDPGFYGVEWSSAIRDLWLPYRRIGAGIRQRLVEAAAARWRVAAESCRTEPGEVVGPDGARLRYGELVVELAGRPLPEDPPLKPPDAFRLLGRAMPGRLAAEIVTGRLEYGLDTAVPDALVAILQRPPNRGAVLKGFQPPAPGSVRGLVDVRAIGPGVAVIAESTWAALKARQATRVEWDLGERATLSQPEVEAAMKRALDQAPSLVPLRFATAPPDEPAASEATYTVPFQAHAAIEPTACTARIADGRCTLWMATQNPPHLRRSVARALGWDESRIVVHPATMGGSFGRKYEPDPGVEAALLAQATGRAIKVMWTREDELRNGPHRPAQAGRLRAWTRADGLPRAMEIRKAGPSYFIREAEALDRLRDRRGGLDGSTFEGICPLLYPVPELALSQHWIDFGITVGSWRSTAHSMNTFFLECFVDELAASRGEDPLEYRRRWLRDGQPFPRARVPEHAWAPELDVARLLAVMDRAAERAGWGRSRPEGVGLGMAVHHAYEGYGALVAEVDARERPRVSALWLCADLGVVANPSAVEQQLTGGVVFGLTAAVAGGLSIAEGAVEQSNYHDFPLLALRDSPVVQVELVSSDAPPAGAGEAGVPLAAPAVANAWFAARGERLRDLPLRWAPSS